MIPDPGGRDPAPGRLRLVQAFVNTVDIEHGHEELERPEDLARLLRRLHLIAPRVDVGEDDLARAVELREALRSLLLANNGVPLARGALQTLNACAAEADLTVDFTRRDGPTLESRADGVTRALGTLVAVVFTSMAEGSWPRLKACRRDVCHWVFWDRSRNRSSTWCAMSVCGNRTKTKRYRRRSARV